MNAALFKVARVAFFLGFLLPILHYASSIKYHRFLTMIGEPFIMYNINMVSVMLVTFTILWLAFGNELRSKRIQTIGTLTAMGCVLLPSLLLLISIGMMGSIVQFVSNLYLSWIGAVVVMLPILWIFKLANSTLNLKDGVTAPISYNIAGYLSIIFLNSIENLRLRSMMEVDSLSYIGLRALIMLADFISSLLSSIIPISTRRAFFISELSSLGELPTWLIAIFVITSATYFYFRLGLGKDESILERGFNRLESITIESTLFSIGISILTAVVLTATLFWIIEWSSSLGLPITITLAILLIAICVMELLKRVNG
ncbi:MAG: hypothetical protein RMJ31_04990 [Nitrososphaerota archaeon]|nr:hypothetical protein [Nitrososphaerota archaeon]